MMRLSFGFGGGTASVGGKASAIKLTTLPTIAALTEGDAIGDFTSAGSYYSTEGTISTVTPDYRVNGNSVAGTTVVSEGDRCRYFETVVDSAGNMRTFRSLPVYAAGVPVEPSAGIAREATSTFSIAADVVSATGALPAGLVEGDVVVIAVVADTNPDGAEVTATGITFTTIDDQTGGNPSSSVFVGVCGANPGSTVDVNLFTGRGAETIVVAASYSGVDTTTPLDATTAIASNTTGLPDPGPLTTVSDGAMRVVVACLDDEQAQATLVTPAPFTTAAAIHSPNTSGSTVLIADYLETTAATLDPDAFTDSSGADDSWYAYHLALRPATAGAATFTDGLSGAVIYTQGETIPAITDAQGLGDVTVAMRNVALPSVAGDYILLEIGGSSPQGLAVYLSADGTLTMRAGRIQALPDARSSYFSADVSSYLGTTVDIFLDIDNATDAIRGVIGNTLIGQDAADGGYVYEKWASTDTGGYGTYTGSVPTNVPTTDWPETLGQLEIYFGTTSSWAG